MTQFLYFEIILLMNKTSLSTEKESQSSRKWTFIILLGISFALAVLSLLLFYKNQQLNKKIANTATAQSASPEETPSLSPNTPNVGEWKTYQDQKYGFSFDYPSDWEIMETENYPEVLQLYEKQLYFLKRNDSEQTYVPSLFSIKLYVNEEKERDLSNAFKSFYEDQNKSILQRIEQGAEQAPTDPYVTAEEINLGGQKATKVEYTLGMIYGETYITWFSNKKGVVMGSIAALTPWPTRKFDKLGMPPYGDNEIIRRIISSFQIQPAP